MFKRGREFERGRSPLSLLLPSPAKTNTEFADDSGWRGVRGEVIIK